MGYYAQDVDYGECPYCGLFAQVPCRQCGADGEGAPWALNEVEDDYGEESFA